MHGPTNINFLHVIHQTRTHIEDNGSKLTILMYSFPLSDSSDTQCVLHFCQSTTTSEHYHRWPAGIAWILKFYTLRCRHFLHSKRLELSDTASHHNKTWILCSRTNPKGTPLSSVSQWHTAGTSFACINSYIPLFHSLGPFLTSVPSFAIIFRLNWVSKKAHILFEIRSHGNDISRTTDVLVLCKVTLLTLTTYAYSGGADTAPANPTVRGVPTTYALWNCLWLLLWDLGLTSPIIKATLTSYLYYWYPLTETVLQENVTGEWLALLLLVREVLGSIALENGNSE